ncbi:aTPase/histidine kinase/DNA gyrase B/HSP90 domain protein [Blautia hydrogenotrophica CAG:147]|mgnify:FL=1|uniref:molecular chaperone HtpG n=1 Tax=Blautia hydrogenotrophica TaxID=53443 RepID=UPI00033E4350|nr:molecular chaperone HtpG [Blautia hydrogenotrophica]CCX58540.1 aTPase/histidine kinase/DNA gyrase B/HSP90 domain protein [Blautia hydrogenotrophica CAG:147]
MAAKHGSLSINSENIFPIIKKWLYSDHDIFVREMVSNGCDAITKLKKLEVMGEYSFPDDYKAQINVIVNPEEKTLKFIDTGLGMTADEVEEYITQIAFSGATEFLEKYKDKTTDDQMIGHFGLGFYSAFMVADEVHIDTLSYKEGSTAVHWTCDGGTEYDIQDGNKNTVGTEITLFLNEDSLEFSNEYRMREVLEKYCSFMPVNIYLSKANAEQEYETIEESDLRDDDVIVERIHEEAKTEEKENENGEKEIVEVSPAKDKVKINKRPVSLSDTHPLWTKHPNECDDEDYRSFYRKVFLDYKEPLFWIHLNMDYPFNLKGILYFPKINTEYDSIEGTIKLYNNQVFIADNIKEVIPEFLMLLKGVIDCPDLPLNVSRSALQNDGFVQKISEYITKKVADKLTGMCKTDRESYEKYWDDISPFIKFGCIKDQKFSEKMMDYILFKNLDDQYLTLKDCIEKNKKETDESITEETTTEEQDKENKEEDSEKEPKKTILYYVTDPVQQSQYINLFKEQGMDAVILRHNIDTAFISHLEQLNQEIRFQRIDTDVTDSLKEDAETDEELAKSLTELFRKNLNKEKLEVKVEKLKNENLSAMMTLSEDSRRMQEMMKMYNMYGMDPNMFGGDETLVLNANHPLVQFVVEHQDSQKVPIICEQLYDLAMLSHKQLSPEEMTRFVNRSNEIMMMLTDIKA